MNARKNLIQKHHFKYKNLTPKNIEDVGHCFYCGSIANELDHMPSLYGLDYVLAIRPSTPLLLVPSCAECNRIASSNIHFDLLERFEYIRSVYKTKKKYRIPHDAFTMYSNEDLSEYGRVIRSTLESNIAEGQVIDGKLRHIPYDFYVDGLTLDLETLPTLSEDKFDVDGVVFSHRNEAEKYIMNTYKLTRLEIRSQIKKSSTSYDTAVKLALEEKARTKTYRVAERIIKDCRVPIPCKKILNRMVKDLKSIPDDQIILDMVIKECKSYFKNIGIKSFDKHIDTLTKYQFTH